jgi:hypothetical protein
MCANLLMIREFLVLLLEMKVGFDWLDAIAESPWAELSCARQILLPFTFPEIIPRKNTRRVM